MTDPDGGRHRRSFRDDWNPRAVIALVVILGAFAMGIVSIITGRPGASIPAWVVALLGAITVFYYKNGKGE